MSGDVVDIHCSQFRSLYLTRNTTFSHLRSFLRKFKFDYLVVDEGHTLKVRFVSLFSALIHFYLSLY